MYVKVKDATSIWWSVCSGLLPSWNVFLCQQLSVVLGYWSKISGMVLGRQETLGQTHLPKYCNLKESKVKGDGTIYLNCFDSMPKKS